MKAEWMSSDNIKLIFNDIKINYFIKSLKNGKNPFSFKPFEIYKNSDKKGKTRMTKVLNWCFESFLYNFSYYKSVRYYIDSFGNYVIESDRYTFKMSKKEFAEFTLVFGTIDKVYRTEPITCNDDLW